VNGVPTVEAVFRYPVKPMLGTRVEQAEVRASGLVGDRGWALVDRQTGKVASAKQPRLWRSLLQLRAGGSGRSRTLGAAFDGHRRRPDG
jgi:MOSC domain-containing protein